MPSGLSLPPALRLQSSPSARAARSSWARPCTPAISTASSSCSAERWVPPRAPTLRRPRWAFSYLSHSSWPGPAPYCPALLGLASLYSAKLAARSPRGAGSASPPGRAQPGAAQARAGPSCPLSQPGASRSKGIGGPGWARALILSTQPESNQDREPLPSVFPTLKPIPLLAPICRDPQCRFYPELFWRALKYFLLRPRWFPTRRAS